MKQFKQGQAHTMRRYRDLDDSELAAVVGGGSSGYYGTIGYNAFGWGRALTVDSAGNFYSSRAQGVGNGVSLSAGGGSFYSNGTPQDFFSGSGQTTSIGANEGGKFSVDVSSNDSGISTGFSAGVGGSIGGVGISHSNTETEHLGNLFGSQDPSSSQLAKDAGIQDIDQHSQLAHDAGIQDIGKPDMGTGTWDGQEQMNFNGGGTWDGQEQMNFNTGGDLVAGGFGGGDFFT